MLTNWKKIIMKLAVAVLMIVSAVNVIFVKPISLSEEGVEKIFVAVEISTDELEFHGRATVTKQSDREEVIKALNRIRAFRFGNYSVSDLEGDSPTAWVVLYDKEGEELDTIPFYQNIVSCGEGKFYKISMSEYDKLLKICNTYGDFPDTE